jgi:hypothetical protein
MLITYELKCNPGRYQIVRVEDQTRRTEVAVFDDFKTAAAVSVDLIKSLERIGTRI